MVKKGLKKEFINGVLWGIIQNFSGILVGFVITILLARKLMPEDYGLINMLAIFNVLSLVLVDSGFGQALIQKKNVSSIDYSSVFYFNIVFSLCIYIALYLLAPFIADFYHTPKLILIAKVSFLLIPINSLAIVQHTILTKELKVKKIALVTVISSLFSGAIGLFFAYNNYGVWALVAQTLSMYLIRVIILWLVSDWRPICAFSFNSIKSIFSFSMNLLGVYFSAAIFNNIYVVLIGRYFNINDVGYYNQAQRLEQTATSSLNSAIQAVTFPAFSKIQSDKKKLLNVYKRIITFALFINFPIMLGLVIPAADIVKILLSEKWLPCVPYFRLLCVVGSIYPLHMININVIKALGKGRLYFRLDIFKRILMILGIFITIRFSIYYLLCSYLVTTLISVVVNSYFCGKNIGYSLKNQIKDIVPIVFSTFVFLTVLYFFNGLIVNSFIKLLTMFFVGSLSYLASSYFLKIPSFYEAMAIIKNKKE